MEAIEVIPQTKVTSHDVAKYFLKLSDPEVGDLISNLKLQKLVYYAQGFHLALYGTPLFDEDIVAWEHGPVVVELYRSYRQYGAGAIPVPDEVNLDKFSEDQRDLLDEVSEVYGQFSAWKLRNMTHSEAPWENTKMNEVIDRKLMKDFFSTLLK